MLCVYPGIYYEDMTDVMMSVLSRGFYTSEPVSIFNNYGAHFILGQLYASLEKLFPIGWYGILNLFFTYLAVINILYCVFLSTTGKDKYIRYLFIAAILIFLVNDILFIQYTKTSIYLIFTSVWIISYNLRNKIKTAQSKLLIGYNIILFVIGLLLRQFSILLVVFIYFPILLIQFIQNDERSFKKLAITAISFFAVSALIIYTSALPYNSTDKQYAAFANYKISIWDNAQPANTLHFQNSKDSMYFKCLSSFYIPEKAVCDPNYLNKIGVLKAHSLLNWAETSFKQLNSKISASLARWQEITSDKIVNRFTVILLILPFIFIRSRKNIMQATLYLLWISFCLIAISIIVKMESRVLFPSVLILLVLIIDKIDKTENQQITTKYFMYIFSLVFIYHAFLYVQSKYFIASKRLQGQQEINKLINDFKNYEPTKIYLLDWITINMLENEVIHSNTNAQKLNWYSVDAAYLVFYDEYYKKRTQITGTATLKDFLKYLQLHKDNFVFLYSENRTNLFAEYSKTIYNIDLKFSAPTPIITEGEIFNGKYNFYRYTLQ
ncbi:MAG: hypothetical protein U0U67_14340 [Chitinophagales bacterium]